MISDKADLIHEHNITDITNLQTVLNSKLNITDAITTYYTIAQATQASTDFYIMLTTYYDTRSVSGNTYVSKG